MSNMTRVLVAGLMLALVAAAATARHHRHAKHNTQTTSKAQKSLAPPKPGDMVTTYLGDMKVNYWEPARVGQTPLILFSHSFAGCGTQASFMMSELAKQGWLVMAPNHADAKCNQQVKAEQNLPETGWWTDKMFLNRRDDMKRLYRTLRYEPLWKNRIDWSRMAIMGQGLGGYTALALAGGQPSWKLDGFTAVLALTPACAPLSLNGHLEDIAVPVMYQDGARNQANIALVKEPNGCFDRTGGSAAYVEFDKAGPAAWTDGTDTGHAKMVNYAKEFFVAAFAGKPMKLVKVAGVTDLRQK